MKSMRAMYFRDVGKFELGEAEKPKFRLGSDDVFIKVKLAGICGTDLHIYHGNHPATKDIILGHEYTGIVEGIGQDVKHLKLGDKVVVAPNLTCGFCYNCRNGTANQCPDLDKGTTLGIFRDGGFTEYNIAPARAVYKIPDDMDFEKAAIAEPLSCVMNSLSKTNIQLEDHVLILGAGPIGALFADLVSWQASHVMVAEIEKARRDHVKDLCHADRVINPKKENLLEVVLEETDGRKADVVIDATGVLMEDALKYVKKGGKLTLFGMNENYKCEIKPYDIVRNEITIIGTFIDNMTFDAAIEALYHDKVNADSYVADTIPLENIFEGFKLLGLDPITGKATPREAMKILVEP